MIMFKLLAVVLIITAVFNLLQLYVLKLSLEPYTINLLYRIGCQVWGKVARARGRG